MVAYVLRVKLEEGPTDWASWITATATAATGLVLAITAFLALRGLGDARRTRHGLLVIELSRRWDEPLVVESIKSSGEYGNEAIGDMIEKLFGGNEQATEEELDTYYTLAAAPNLIETIGVLVSEGVISVRVIHKAWGPIIVSLWRGWEGPTELLREHDEQDAEASYLYFERLAGAMEKLDKPKGRFAPR